MENTERAPEGNTDREADDRGDVDLLDVHLGQPLFTEDGERVGTVRGFDQSSIYVSIREGAEALSIEHERSGHEFGEAELMWRCMNCGEMGEIDEGLPEQCPNCGVEREELMYWTED